MGAQAYHEGALLVKRAEMLARMERARIFDPLHVAGAPVTEADVNALAAFRFTKKPEYAPLLPKMKDEITKYNALVAKIKQRSERLDKDGNGTFDLLAWWRANMAELASWAAVLRAVLTHSPNSCPPERVFSILNDTFDEDQKRALADYMELSLMVQYNERDPRR